MNVHERHQEELAELNLKINLLEDGLKARPQPISESLAKELAELAWKSNDGRSQIQWINDVKQLLLKRLTQAEPNEAYAKNLDLIISSHSKTIGTVEYQLKIAQSQLDSQEKLLQSIDLKKQPFSHDDNVLLYNAVQKRWCSVYKGDWMYTDENSEFYKNCTHWRLLPPDPIRSKTELPSDQLKGLAGLYDPPTHMHKLLIECAQELEKRNL